MRQMTTYRRSRPPRRSSYRQQQGGDGKGGAGRVLLGLVAVAAIIYFLMASAAGSWISENIVNPVMEAFNPSQPESELSNQEPMPLPAAAQPGDQAQEPPAAEADSQAGSGSKSTQAPSAQPPAAGSAGTEFKLKGATLYGVQMGAFQSEENASKEADVVRTRGGAGYVFFDGELYRVLASAYGTETEATEVRDQLKQDLIDSGICKLEIKEVDLRVTAGENVVSALNGAVSALEKAREDMLALSIAYDKKEVTAADAAGRITAMKNDIGGAAERLKAEAGTNNSVIKSLNDCCEKIMEDLANLNSLANASALDFSSRMKYTQIGLIVDTIKFVDAITKSS